MLFFRILKGIVNPPLEKKEILENLIRTYERYVAPVTFLIGFVFDTFTLRRIDLWLDHLILLSYLALAGAGIFVLSAYGMGRLRFRIMDVSIPMVPVVVQFAFGGLFSAFVIFYTRSSAPTINWLFLLVLAVLLIGNERLRKRYEKLVFQLSVYFFAVFSYSIFLVPILVRKIGTEIFLLSGFVSLAAIALFLLLLNRVTGEALEGKWRTLLFSIGTIFIFFNILYFANLIPPIPLALKESGVYHAVERVESSAYRVRYEKAAWYNFLQETSSTYHKKSGEPAYVFTAIFAPTKFDIAVMHRWSRYDEALDRWVEYEKIPFAIRGGRDGGYRGYTYKTNIAEGDWRVDVITENGQILGRQSFRVVPGAEERNLEEVLK